MQDDDSLAIACHSLLFDGNAVTMLPFSGKKLSTNIDTQP